MNLPFLVGPSLLGVALTASLRVATSLVLPAFQLFSALGWVLIAALASEVDDAHARRIVSARTWTTFALGSIYALVVGLFAPEWLSLFFGTSYLSTAPGELRILALGIPFAAAAASLSAAFRAMSRPDLSTLLAFLGVLPLGVALAVAATSDIGGVAMSWGMSGSSLVSCGAAIWILRRARGVTISISTFQSRGSLQ
jgi:Na+-driven multidrug efflux pump